MQVPQPLQANSHYLFILLNLSKAAGENNERIYFTFTLVSLFCDDFCCNAFRNLSSTEIHRIIYPESLHVDYTQNFPYSHILPLEAVILLFILTNSQTVMVFGSRLSFITKF